MLIDLALAVAATLRGRRSSAIMVLTLALPLGTAIAFFSLHWGLAGLGQDVVDRDSLVIIGHPHPSSTGTAMSGPSFRDVKRWTRALSGVEACRPGWTIVEIDSRAEQLHSTQVTAGWFQLLGAAMDAGRPLTTADFRPGAPAVAVISYRLWKETFGKRDVLGQKLPLPDGTSVSIVGVTGEAFDYPMPWAMVSNDLWRPLLDADLGDNRRRRDLMVIGRIPPHKDRAAVEYEQELILAELMRRHPEMDSASYVDYLPFYGWDNSTQRVALYLLLEAALGLLLAGCANVSAQFLGRTLQRRREHAMQVAVGASRARLVRQLFIEAALLGGAGLLAAWPVAWAWLSYMQSSYASARRIAGFRAAGLDLPTVLFAVTITGVVVILMALPSALQSARRSVQQILKEAGSTHTGAGTRILRDVLLAAQLALATSLLIIATTSVKSLVRDLEGKGFDSDGVIYLRTEFIDHLYEGQFRFKYEASRQLRSMPGVQSAGFIWPPPLGRGEDLDPGTVKLVTELPLAKPAEQGQVYSVEVSGAAFHVFGVPLLAGRLFEGDDSESPLVAVVDSAFVGRYFPGVDPLGKKIAFREGIYTIVGVVASMVPSPGMVPRPTLYRYYRQVNSPAAVFVIKGDGSLSSAALLAQAEAVLRGIRPAQPILAKGRYDTLIAENTISRRSLGGVTLAFGALATLLAALGLHAATSASLAARRRELGLRVAIGSSPGRVVALVVARSLPAMLAGLAGGVVLARTSKERTGETVFGGLQVEAAMAVAVCAAVLFVATLSLALAAWWPSRRPPYSALRYE